MSLPGSTQSMESEHGGITESTEPIYRERILESSQGTPKDLLQLNTSREMLKRRSGSCEKLGSKENTSPGHLSPRLTAADPRNLARGGSCFAIQGSEVIRTTIHEHELESASLTTIEKAEALEEERDRAKAKEERSDLMQKGNLQSPKRLVSAVSTSSIPGSSNATTTTANPLNVKRTQSNLDMLSSAYGKAPKQPAHPKLKGKLSAPPESKTHTTGKTGKSSTAHKRTGSDLSGGTMALKPAGSHTNSPLHRKHSPSQLPQAQNTKSEKNSKKNSITSGTSKASAKNDQIPPEEVKFTLSPQNSSNSLRHISSGQMSGVEGAIEEDESGIESLPATHDQLSSSSEGEVMTCTL